MNGSRNPWTDDISVKPRPDLPAPAKNPALLWPSISHSTTMQNCDLPHFPDRNLVTQRYGSDKDVLTLGLQSFQSAVKQAEVCVLVLDLHFDEVGTRVLGPALEYTKAEDIRLLTGNGKIDEERRMQLFRTLRVRPETLCRITEFSEHESNGRELDEGERVAVEVLPVLGQSAAAVEPGDGAFDHPTPGLDDEALHPIGSLDDLGLEIGQDAGQGATGP